MGFIYKIENLITNDVYIGQTTKTKPERRFKEHLKLAKTEPRYILHKAIATYGLENFSFSIVEEVPNERLNSREVYWIAYYNSYLSGYNMTPGGKAPKKKKYCKASDEQILSCYFKEASENGAETARILGISEDTVYRRLKEYNIKARNRHEVAVAINNNTKKSIWQVDIKTLQVVKEWESISATREEFGYISGAIEGRKCKTHKGFFWCYATQESYQRMISKIQNCDIEKSLQNYYKIQQIHPKTKEVLNVFDSIKEAAEFLNKTRTAALSAALNGHQKTAYGFVWKKILQF